MERNLLEGHVFEKGDIRAHMHEATYRTNEHAEVGEAYWLSWSITRL